MYQVSKTQDRFAAWSINNKRRPTHHRETEPYVEEAVSGRAVVTLSGTQVARVEVPDPTSDNSVGSTGDSRRVYDGTRKVCPVPILSPFPKIS